MSEETDLFGNTIEKVEEGNLPEVLSAEDRFKLERMLDELLILSNCCLFEINTVARVGHFSSMRHREVALYGPDSSKICLVINLDGAILNGEDYIVTEKQLLNATKTTVGDSDFEFRIKAFLNTNDNVHDSIDEAYDSVHWNNPSIEVLCNPTYPKPQAYVDCGFLPCPEPEGG